MRCFVRDSGGRTVSDLVVRCGAALLFGPSELFLWGEGPDTGSGSSSRFCQVGL